MFQINDKVACKFSNCYGQIEFISGTTTIVRWEDGTETHCAAAYLKMR